MRFIRCIGFSGEISLKKLAGMDLAEIVIKLVNRQEMAKTIRKLLDKEVWFNLSIPDNKESWVYLS
jgi:hypothetical protein